MALQAIQDKDILTLTDALNQLGEAYDLNQHDEYNPKCLNVGGYVTLLGIAIFHEFPEGVELLLARGHSPNYLE